MDGQEPQNTSGGASAAGAGPDHGYHRTAAVARPGSGRSTVLPALADQLLDRGHYFSGFCVPNGEANLERHRPTRSGVSNPATFRRTTEGTCGLRWPFI